MAKLLPISFLAFALGLAATNARADIALNTTSTEYLGFIQSFKGNSANPESEAALINLLITLAAGAGPTQLPTPNPITYFDRRASTLDPVGGFPEADGGAGSFSRVNGGIYNGIPVDGYTYLAGKYGGPNVGLHVWYVSGLTGTYSIPEKLGDPVDGSKPLGLSHYTLFNPVSVPDGGLTLMLLGGALISIDTLRRGFRSRNSKTSDGVSKWLTTPDKL
jgi:hypothetical protein